MGLKPQKVENSVRIVKVIACLIIANFPTELFALHAVTTAHGATIEASEASECLVKLGHHATRISDKPILNGGVGGRHLCFWDKNKDRGVWCTKSGEPVNRMRCTSVGGAMCVHTCKQRHTLRVSMDLPCKWSQLNEHGER